MMAVRSPLGFSPSTNPLFSPFSPFGDNPNSPRPRTTANSGLPMSATEKSNSTSNDQLKPPPTNYIASPLAPVAPSPVSSDITNFEDVDEEVEEEEGTERGSVAGVSTSVHDDHRPSVSSPLRELVQHVATPLRVETRPSLDDQFRAKLEDEREPQSVIHIPTGFGQFPARETARLPTTEEQSTPLEPTSEDQLRDSKEADRARADSTDSVATVSTVTQIVEPQAKPATRSHEGPMPPTPLQTSLPSFPLHDWSRTPRAQTRQEFGSLSRPGSSLASIQEGEDTDHPESDETGAESHLRQRFLRDAEAEVDALHNALSECWTLCNTLANLSYIHRERIFNFSGQGDMQEQAWKSCWKLCQNLYDTRDDHAHPFTHNSSRPALDLCRDFCQALFEVRVRDNETADSVLRVSFELNNHLFNTHDRSLPEAFRERTLDFYITLCHRLMKQKSKMADETDSLLRACWSLAEMLFSLRQNKREGKRPDEELLGSAIQACWELCDLFREGWTQIRPERGTPRPSQTTFTQAFNQAKRSGFAPLDDNGMPRLLPETPTTIFEDTVTTISPDEAPIPNILVLGAEEASRMSSASSTSSTPAPNQSRQLSPNPPIHRNVHSANPAQSSGLNYRWSSGASVLSLPASAASEGPNPVSATTVSTVRTPADDPTLILLKTLFARAAMVTGRGYTRQSADPNLNNLPTFVRNLPDNAFGSQTWQVALLDHYRKAIANDSAFRNLGMAGTIAESGRVNAVELARAVKGMTSCVYGFNWLRDLYRYVFGYYVEEALKGANTHAGGARKAVRQTGPAASLAAVMGSNTPTPSAGGEKGNSNGNGHTRRTISQ